MKEWAWAEEEAKEALHHFPREVQEAFEEALGQRRGELHPVGDHREEVWVQGHTYRVWTFLDHDGTLWVTTPPKQGG